MGGLYQPVHVNDPYFVGERRPFVWRIVDEEGDPKNLTGVAVQLRLFLSEDGTEVLTKAAVVQNGAGTGDEVSVTPDSSEFDDLITHVYFYIVERTDVPEVLAYGEFPVRRIGL